MKLLNAFSLNMVPFNGPYGHVELRKLGIYSVRDMLNDGIESAVGHPDTARILSGILGMEVPCNRVNVTLQPDETCIVAQYTGPRLPEGATTLPEGADITFIEVQCRTYPL